MKTTTRNLILLAAGVFLLPIPARAQDAAQMVPPKSAMERKNRAPVAKETLRVRFPKPQEFTLPNGMKVMILEDHKLPTVSMSMRIAAGSFFEPAEKQGLASMVASMLSEGTKARTSQKLAAEVDSLGADLNASADQGGEFAVIGAGGFAEDFNTLVTLMADIARNPVFPEDQFAKIKVQTSAGLTQAAKNPRSLTRWLALQSVYGDSAPARVMPTPEHVDSLTRQDLVDFHDTYYRPDRVILGISGDVNPDEALKAIRDAFGTWQKGSASLRAGLPEYKRNTETRSLVLDRPGSVQTILRIGNLGLNRKNPDYFPAFVMNFILGGTGSSRLEFNLREMNSLTYVARSLFSAPRYPGYIGATTEVRNAVTAKAVEEIFNEFKRMQTEPVSDEELNNTKRSLVGSFALELESPESLLSYAMMVEEQGLPKDYWDRYPEHIEAVTQTQVMEVARKYLGEKGHQIVAVGERASIEPALKPYGEITFVPDPSK